MLMCYLRSDAGSGRTGEEGDGGAGEGGAEVGETKVRV